MARKRQRIVMVKPFGKAKLLQGGVEAFFRQDAIPCGVSAGVPDVRRTIGMIVRMRTVIPFFSFILIFSFMVPEAFAIEVELSWITPRTDVVIDGYNIYYGRTSGQYDTFVSVSDITNVILDADFIEGQIYYFVVTTLDPEGNESEFSREVNIKVLAGPPEVDFTSSVTSGNSPFLVEFFDASLHFPQSWKWDFGDGTISNEQNPHHIYSYPGEYSVKLTATNELGSTTFERMAYIVTSSCPYYPAKVGGFENQTLQGAYDVAEDGEIILSQAIIFEENLLLDKNIAITLYGGFNCSYTELLSETKIDGTLLIKDGSLTVENLVIQ